jgi:catechol 2,3-dioxygenase
MGSVPPQTRIGHVHLKVTDLDRSEKFYTEVLGMERKARLGDQATFLAYGDYHHHLGLNVWHSKGKGPAPVEAAGLYHFAIIYPSRKDLANAVKRVLDSGWTIDGAADHRANVSIYMHDPDHNGIELYYDIPQEQWAKNPDGTYALGSDPLDVQALLDEAD